MKETGIIMSGNHPKLILDGIKTQTRRVINPQPELEYGVWSYIRFGRRGPHATCTINWSDMVYPPRELLTYCPYGQVGDRLWVRETWRINNYDVHPIFRTVGGLKIGYKAGGETVVPCSLDSTSKLLKHIYWSPSIHMFRDFSRITLEITELWAEMLRSISPADAIAEGGYTVEEFIRLYLKINHLPDDADPWNWAIKYKLLGMGN